MAGNWAGCRQSSLITRLPTIPSSSSSSSSKVSHISSCDIIISFHQTILSFNITSAFMMKAALVLASGAALVGSAYAGGVHKMKLQKIPLSEQLAHADIATHGKALYQKYGGQKFMGSRPEHHKEEMFKDTSIHPDADGHPLPVSNFLNAQCKIFLSSQRRFSLIIWQISRKSALGHHLKRLKLYSTRDHLIYGSPQQIAARSLAFSIPRMIPRSHQHTSKTVLVLKYDTALAA